MWRLAPGLAACDECVGETSVVKCFEGSDWKSSIEMQVHLYYCMSYCVMFLIRRSTWPQTLISSRWCLVATVSPGLFCCVFTEDAVQLSLSHPRRSRTSPQKTPSLPCFLHPQWLCWAYDRPRSYQGSAEGDPSLSSFTGHWGIVKGIVSWAACWKVMVSDPATTSDSSVVVAPTPKLEHQSLALSKPHSD